MGEQVFTILKRNVGCGDNRLLGGNDREWGSRRKEDKKWG